MRNIAKTRKDYVVGCYNSIMFPEVPHYDKWELQRVQDSKKDLDALRQKCLNSPEEPTDEDCAKISEIYINCILSRYEGLSGLNIKADNEEICGGEDAEEGYLDGLNSLDSGELFFAFSICAVLSIVNVIIYVEDGKAKIYAPEKGNQYCREHMCAYGEEPDYQDKIQKSDWEEKYEAEIPEIDMDEELKDIADYFENRSENQHADDSYMDIL